MRTTLEVRPDATMENTCAKWNYLESATTTARFYAADGEFLFEFICRFISFPSSVLRNRSKAGMYFWHYCILPKQDSHTLLIFSSICVPSYKFRSSQMIAKYFPSLSSFDDSRSSSLTVEMHVWLKNSYNNTSKVQITTQIQYTHSKHITSLRK